MASTAAGLAARGRHRLKQHVDRPRKSLEQAGLFLKNFARHPQLVGSVVPSSRYLVNRALDRVDWTRTRTVVEYGPGVGTFTRSILERLPSDGRLLAIELNREFCQVLSSEIDDPRFRLVHGSADEVDRWMSDNSLPAADFIMSGLPYTLFSREMRQSILTASHDVLSQRGVFISFQYTRSVLPDLKSVFGNIREDFEPINILPAWIFSCYRHRW